MDVNFSNPRANTSVTPTQSPLPEHLVKSQRGGFSIISGLLVLLLLVVGGAYYLGLQRNAPQTSPIVDLSPNASQQTNAVASPISSSDTTNDVSEWETYTNSLHKYTVKYPPNFPPSTDMSAGESLNSIIFGCKGEGYCLPPYYISVMPYPSGTEYDNVYNSLSKPTIDKIFTLKVGNELDQETTYDIGGKWDFPTRYKRLPDETINGEKFLVIENPKWYGGSDRRLFIKKNNNVYMIGSTYSTTAELNTFKNIYSSFRFTK